MSTSKQEQPKGELVSRAIAMPADTNANGDIFGGWVMSQMDLGASVIARTLANRRVATVAVDAMSFIYPISVGDLVSCYAQLESHGTTSMKINVEVWVDRAMTGKAIRTTEAVFTFVAIDENGRPVPIKLRK